jgi:hypothetical protein
MGIVLLGYVEGRTFGAWRGNDIKEGYFWSCYQCIGFNEYIVQYLPNIIEMIPNQEGIQVSCRPTSLASLANSILYTPLGSECIHGSWNVLHSQINKTVIIPVPLALNGFEFPRFIGSGISKQPSQVFNVPLIEGVLVEQFNPVIIRDSDLSFTNVIPTGFADRPIIESRVNDLILSVSLPLFITSSLAHSDISMIQYMSGSVGEYIVKVRVNDLIEGLQISQWVSFEVLDHPATFIHELGLDITNFTLLFSFTIPSEIEPRVPFGKEDSDPAILWYDPPPAPIPSILPILKVIQFDILIDGISCRNRLSGASITQQESDILTHVELVFKDTTFFSQCSITAGSGPGTERITVRVGEDITDPNRHTLYKFLLEERSASEAGLQFTVWGRSKAAILTEPFSPTITKTYENMNASTIVSDLAGSIPIVWGIDDHVHYEFNVDGYPLDAIQQLAEVIGGVVRATPEGSLVVRRKFPARPRDLIRGDIVTGNVLDRYSAIVEADYSEEQPQYNAVDVLGGGKYSSWDFSIEAENDCIEPGTPAFFKVYHSPGITIYNPNESGVVGYQVCTTISLAEVNNLNVVETITDEYIDIINEAGSLNRECFRLISTEWHGTPKGSQCIEPDDIEITITGKDISVPNVLTGRLKVSYETQYDRFKIQYDQEADILIGILAPEHEGIYIRVIMQGTPGDKLGPEIQDDLITNENMAVLRGQSFLDDMYYRKHKWTLKIPFYLPQGLFDGSIVRMEDDFWGLVGNAIIRQADISFDLEEEDVHKIWQNLEVHMFSYP